jgi:hypothetical protein
LTTHEAAVVETVGVANGTQATALEKAFIEFAFDGTEPLLIDIRQSVARGRFVEESTAFVHEPIDLTFETSIVVGALGIGLALETPSRSPTRWSTRPSSAELRATDAVLVAVAVERRLPISRSMTTTSQPWGLPRERKFRRENGNEVLAEFASPSFRPGRASCGRWSWSY